MATLNEQGKPRMPSKEQQAKDEAVIKEFFESSEEISHMHEPFMEFCRASMRWHKDEDEIREKYPCKWVAVGEAGVVALGDTMYEARDKAVAAGLREWQVVVGYLTPNPSKWYMMASAFVSVKRDE